MLILIMGENSSGKSAYAEKLVARMGGGLYYIATMIPHGEEGAARVNKHRAQRVGLGFATLELPYAVGGADIPPEGAVLLEDVSNLLANRMFERGGTVADTLTDIKTLLCRCRALVAVSIQGLEGADYEGETRTYIAALAALNDALIAAADLVIEMRRGMPQVRKGEFNAIF
ncbi:MAG: bifunctional adenosylcobinamide kinase/adenosylcobinamide-phosphate guanylyltransferase [Candidatus Pelethousia sp.]|nr:bifunctional adenosylcobinamide kinase/adenosylcobinamide-phosphate guanylyltransferase [Candidatus Pelethousia sp.]